MPIFFISVHVPTTNLNILQPQQVTEHSRSRKRVVEVQLVDQPHQHQIAL
jgi:hypothetical protein